MSGVNPCAVTKANYQSIVPKVEIAVFLPLEFVTQFGGRRISEKRTGD